MCTHKNSPQSDGAPGAYLVEVVRNQPLSRKMQNGNRGYLPHVGAFDMDRPSPEVPADEDSFSSLLIESSELQ